MDILDLLGDKTRKATGKREALAQALRDGAISVADFRALGALDEKAQGILLEAMEAVTGKQPEVADAAWLEYAIAFLDSPANSCKREASRIVGNIAHRFPEVPEVAIQKLLSNTTDSGTVVRWGSAYALGRIVALPGHADTALFDTLTAICESEQNGGVKNQYLAGLKKAAKLRKG